MAELTVEKKTVGALFSDKSADFLIPPYQRPYAWTEDKCKTLWDDIFAFAFPEDNCDAFDNDECYYLGSIVTFSNKATRRQEVIDGQQRLTTLMLLLRAFYTGLQKQQSEREVSVRELIARCLWKTDDFGQLVFSEPKICSEVVTVEDNDEFRSILLEGDAQGKNSQYARNYRFFQRQIEAFQREYASYFLYMPVRILNNCILLPIEASEQDTALRIFSTLNDRGMPLADADIFKAQLFLFYSDMGRKTQFIERWKELEDRCGKVFRPYSGTPLDEVFTQYMYYARALRRMRLQEYASLRKFYERDDRYALLKQESTFDALCELAGFWEDVARQNRERFSEEALRRLFVLHYAPNRLWTYFVSAYYLQYRDAEGRLDDAVFCTALDAVTALLLAYGVARPGVDYLRPLVYEEICNVTAGASLTFSKNDFPAEDMRNALRTCSFDNRRPITKSMLAWWAMQQPEQPVFKLETVFEIEHIFAKNHQEKHRLLTDPNNLEQLGNKSLLEYWVNIRASDYQFSAKAKYYRGEIANKPATEVVELKQMANDLTDFGEQDILNRTERMFDSFMAFLEKQGMVG